MSGGRWGCSSHMDGFTTWYIPQNHTYSSLDGKLLTLQKRKEHRQHFHDLFIQRVPMNCLDFCWFMVGCGLMLCIKLGVGMLHLFLCYVRTVLYTVFCIIHASTYSLNQIDSSWPENVVVSAELDVAGVTGSTLNVWGKHVVRWFHNMLQGSCNILVLTNLCSIPGPYKVRLIRDYQSAFQYPGPI
jgi:hypothetical protein